MPTTPSIASRASGEMHPPVRLRSSRSRDRRDASRVLPRTTRRAAERAQAEIERLGGRVTTAWGAWLHPLGTVDAVRLDGTQVRDDDLAGLAQLTYVVSLRLEKTAHYGCGAKSPGSADGTPESESGRHFDRRGGS